jgi:hypothetical protein
MNVNFFHDKIHSDPDGVVQSRAGQPPRTSLKESATQAVVGIPIGLVVSYGVALLHLPPAISAWLITGLMFVASTIRGYIIRRRFERRRANASFGETMHYVFKKERANEQRMGRNPQKAERL